MNILKAMEETLALAREHGLDNMDSDVPSLDYPHLKDMYERVRDGRFEDGSHGEYSYGKQCRWLGWMQAAVVSNINLPEGLEMVKEINKRNAG